MSQGIYAFLLSLLMVYVKEKYHTMTAPILFHMSANIYSVLATETALVDWVTESLGAVSGGNGAVICNFFAGDLADRRKLHRNG